MQKNRKKRVGRVISNKMDNTAVIAVETRRPHRLYKRIVRQTSKFKAHDEKNECQMGDMVQIMEYRPISKEKRWIVTDIISRKEVVEVLETEVEIPKAKPEQAEVKAEAETKATEVEVKAKTKVKAKSEPEAEAKTKVKEVEVKAKTKVKAKSESEPEAEVKTKVKAEVESKAEAELEAEDQS
jgi:small subunit ribosomal protein S17